jgi:dephospho-CoA kinase
VLWIGITGSIGTGKSTFAELLRKQGQIVLDADEIVKLTQEPSGSAYQKIINEFGKAILDKSGRIDRAELAKVVFSSKEKLEKLESIIHPEVRLAVESHKNDHKQKKTKYLFYDVPLLFEKNMEKTFDLVVLVTSNQENQIKRIKLRNKWSDEEIKKRLAAQLPLSEKESRAHILINNDGDLDQLKSEAKKFLEWLNTLQNQD